MSNSAPRRPIPIRKPSWWLDGKHITLSKGLVRVVLADGRPTGLLVFQRADIFSGEVGGRPVDVRVGPAVGVRFLELWSNRQQLPASVKPVPRVAAAEGARCSVHAEQAAQIACARCGRFCCAACISGDGQRCTPCLAHELPVSPLVVDAQPEESGRSLWPVATIMFFAGLSVLLARWPVAIGVAILVGFIAALVSGSLAVRLTLRACERTQDVARVQRINSIFMTVPVALVLSGILFVILAIALMR